MYSLPASIGVERKFRGRGVIGGKSLKGRRLHRRQVGLGRGITGEEVDL